MQVSRNNRVNFGRLVELCLLAYGFIAMPQGAFSDITVAFVFALIALISIVLVIAKYRNPNLSVPNIYVELSYYLAVFVLMFSILYWNYGTRSNFNVQLTHLDAIYFMVGTLSTAGTGNIVATSELTRGLQGLQMLLDLGFLLVAVTLVVTRLSSMRSESK